MSQDEEALRRLLIELQLLRGTMETLRSRLSLVEGALTELQIANSSLQGLKGKDKGSSLLVPVGGGTHVKARLDDPAKVIVGIGAGVATEKTFDQAQESIGRQMTELQKSRLAMEQQLNQIVAKINDTQDKVQSMSESLEGKRVVRTT